MTITMTKTETKAELRRARDQAVEANRAKSAFLAAMSHEVRTPISGILGMIELLKETALDDRQRRYVAAIEGSAEALLSIANEVLDLSRIEAGKMRLECRRFDLPGLIEEVTRLLEPEAQRRGLKIACRVAPEVPAWVTGDPLRIRQVLTNLAANAVKFTDHGQVVLEADRLEAVEVGDGWTIRLAVRDTGIGIAPEHQEAIFERFTQIEGEPARMRAGAGLGLAICRSLVELMGGRIGLESAPGRGSTFWVELPLGALAAQGMADPPAGGAAEAASESGAQPPLAVPLRVLLVEDEEVNRQVAAEMIGRLGCALVAVGDGRAALAALRECDYDVVLMDLELPGLDGLSATAELRRREREAGTGRHVPVIALTASALAGDRQRCLLAGMDDYIDKPLRPRALRQALLRWGRPGSPGPAEVSPAAAPVPPAGPWPDPDPTPPAPAPASTSHAPSFDHGLLAESCGHDPGLIVSVLETFLHSAPAQLSAVAAAVEAGDAAALLRAAHRFKGGCQTIGAAALAAACATHLDRARQGGLGPAPAALELLHARWEEVRADVNDYLDGLRSGGESGHRLVDRNRIVGEREENQVPPYEGEIQGES